MHILLISVNREKTPYPVFPLGLSYLTSSLAAAGHRLQVLDLCFIEDPHAALVKTLNESKPDAVLMSIRNIDNLAHPNARFFLGEIKTFVDLCRGRAPVILGGAGFSLMPREALEFLGGDYGVVGEGEEVVPELLACLSRGDVPDFLPGILVRGAAGYLPPQPVKYISRPDRGMFTVDRYNREGGMINVQTKRGCPFTCIYCNYPLLEGTRTRLRPISEIIAEIRDLKEISGTDYIYFVDDIFNYPPEFAEKLCQAIVAENIKISWSAFINPAFVTPELFEIMAKAGCDAVEFGTDSGSPIMLKNLGKSFGVEQIRSASSLCRELGIDSAHYILFGGPGETETTIDESFALMDELEPTAVLCMTGIRIYPGTPLHRLAVEEGIVAPDASLLEPVFYLSPQVKDSLCDLVLERALVRKNWAAPGLEINMSAAMLQALRHFSVHGPVWKMMKKLGRSRIRPM